MKTLTIMLIGALIISSCSKTSLVQPQPKPQADLLDNTAAKTGNGNGRSTAMPAYYDSVLFTVNMKQLSDKAAENLIAHNSSINAIYASNDLDEEQDFVPVIDAIPGDGFNPLWQQFLIVFNEGFTPHQFFSDEEVLDAASGDNPEITLVNTGEIYRCSVIGPK